MGETDRETKLQIARVIWDAIAEGREVTDRQRSQLSDFVLGLDGMTEDMEEDFDADKPSPAVDRAIAHLSRLDELRDATLGLIGLVQMISHRDDLPAEIRNVLLTNHRFVDACAVVGFTPDTGSSSTKEG